MTAKSLALKRWRKKNPDKVHQQKQRAHLMHKYKLTPKQVQEAIWNQMWECEICSKRPYGKRTTLHVDHNHVTGKFRAMLRNRCNVMIGMAKESIETLQAAIDYLKRHAT